MSKTSRLFSPCRPCFQGVKLHSSCSKTIASVFKFTMFVETFKPTIFSICSSLLNSGDKRSHKKFQILNLSRICCFSFATGSLVRIIAFFLSQISLDDSEGFDGGAMLLEKLMKITPKMNDEKRELREHVKSCFKVESKINFDLDRF